jgi:hypothetical protein
MERAEQKGSEDLHDISGINDAALGAVDKVQSGRALEAKQRQAVIAVQVYMDNMGRSKELLGRKKLEIIQGHYTEERIVRVLGESGTPLELIINQRTAGQIVNNVTMGRYSLVIDETPLSASFASAQFDDLLMLIEKGVLPVQVVQDIAVELSTIPNKELIKRRVQALMAAQGIPVGDDIMTAGGQQLLQAGAMQQIGAEGEGGPPIGGATSLQTTPGIAEGGPGSNIIPIGGPPNG